MTKDGDNLRNDAVDRAWREHAREAPPAALDDAIRAAAHRAVGSKPQAKPAVAEAREPWRWWMPLAAAATIGAIAIGVIQNLPRDAGEPMVVSDASPAARRPATESRAAAPAVPAAVAPASPQAAIAPTTEGGSDAARQSPAQTSTERAAAPAATRAQPPVEAPPTRFAETPAPGKQRVDATQDSKEMAAAKPAAEQVAPQRAPDAQAASLAKRAESDARKVERESTSGFVASPPPAGAPPAVAAAPAPAAAPAASSGLAAAPSGASGAENATDAAARPKLAARAPAMSKAEAPAPEAAAMRDRTAAAPAVAQGSAVKLPDAFVAEIRRLLAANDADAAARELRAFRHAYADADARLPVELRTWAAGVAR